MDPSGQIDFQQLIAAATQMQSQLLSAQQRLADAEVEGSSGGGLVRVTINGEAEVTDVKIEPAALEASGSGDPAEQAQTLADLVLAAFRDAFRAVGELQQEVMGPLSGGPGAEGFEPGQGIPGLPGFTLPGQVLGSDEPPGGPRDGS